MIYHTVHSIHDIIHHDTVHDTVPSGCAECQSATYMYVVLVRIAHQISFTLLVFNQPGKDLALLQDGQAALAIGIFVWIHCKFSNA